MFIESLDLDNYRNYEHARVCFSEGTNLILGKNGRGKTNLIEALFLLATSKSFRKTTDRKLIRRGSSGYRVGGFFNTEHGDVDIAITWGDGKKRVAVNGETERRISDLIGMVYCVLLSFEDVTLVTGPPALRRSFLDLVLSTADPVYFRNLKTYFRVLRQKNSALGEQRPDDTMLSVWNERLARTGASVMERRLSFIHFINGYMEDYSAQLAQFESLPRLLYKTSVPLKEKEAVSLLREMERIKGAEKRMGTSLIGPHRDDMGFLLDGGEVRHSGSLGEARLLSIVLKTAQARYYSLKGMDPIVLIDDILLELDHENREQVLSLLSKKYQTVITTTERERLPEILSPDRVFTISERGKIA